MKASFAPYLSGTCQFKIPRFAFFFFHQYLMADSSWMRIFFWSDLAYSLLAVKSDSWMHRPSCSLGRWRFELRMIGLLLALSTSCVFPLQLHASLPQTYKWIFSMNANCLSLRPPVAKTDGWFPPAQAVFSADLCITFLEHHNHTFLLVAHWRRLLFACLCLPSMWCGQQSAAAPEARWTLYWVGWLSWGLLHLTSGLAIWCQGCCVSSIGETAPVAWSASDRQPRSLHRT